MATFTGRVITPAGNIIPVAGAVPVVSPITIGVTPDLTSGQAAYNTDMQTFTVNGCARGYGPTTLPPWTHPYIAPLVKVGARMFMSAKTPDLAAYVASWDTMPPGRDAWYMYQHECNRPVDKGAPALASVRDFYRQLIAARNAHRNADRIRIGPCFSWYPAFVGHNEASPWAQFMVYADGTAIPYDFMAWDQYNVTGSHLEDPAVFVSGPVAAARAWKLPLAICEFGVHVTTPDTLAATWLVQVCAAYQAAGVTDVMYWNSGSYKLNGRPAPLTTWQKLCT